MHIPDGMLDTKTVAAGWVAAVPAVGWAVRAVRKRASDGRLVLMSVLAALIFALQMLNFPVAGGTSGHFAGGALAAILLGPEAAIVVITAVLVVQAFLFADGGVTALGANIVNMAVIAPLVGWWVFSLAVRLRDSRAGRMAGSFVAGWAAAMSAALGAALMLWASGAAPLLPVAAAMGSWHALIGVGEGIVTSGLIGYVATVRPELLRGRDEVMRPGRLAMVFGLAALAAAGLSFAASSSPDALETVVRALRIGQAAGPAGVAGPLAAYSLPGVGHDAVAGVLAGIVGVVVTGALLAAGLRAIRDKARES